MTPRGPAEGTDAAGPTAAAGGAPSTLATARRTHVVGEIDDSLSGVEVLIAGWVDRRRDHGGILFLDVRDRWGLVQVVVDPADVDPESLAVAQHARAEDVVAVQGTVHPRPAAMVNRQLASGAVEVRASTVELVAAAETPPFPVSHAVGEGEVAEDLRLAYRYLELRRPQLQRNLLLRHAALQATRDFLTRHGFVEVDTPVLTRPTPEGARDYLVPSRVHPGAFYALPQSPQLYKQILMVAGFDRYFQIARCFRDEDLRADRQPEFTQIDLEMSFVSERDVWHVTEGLLAHLWREVAGVELSVPFPVLSHAEAMARFGTDKPDLRFDLELTDVTEVFRGTAFRVVGRALEAPDGVVKALRVPAGASTSRRQLDELTEEARRGGAAGLLWVRPGDPPTSSAGKNLEPERLRAALAAVAAEADDLLLLVAGARRIAERSLGRVRTTLGEGRIDPNALKFLWVSDFPLFEPAEPGDDAVFGIVPSHHPFTGPHAEDEEKLRIGEDLLSVRSRAYDIVLNGVELGSGSIRIHRPDLQRRVFELLGIDEDEARRKFGFLLEAFRYGAPPHGGIAPGFDRIVMLLAGGTSLRDVIAFPKTTQANALMEGAPAAVSERELRDLHLAVDASRRGA